MRRATLVALGTATIITSAAALGIGETRAPQARASNMAETFRALDSARIAQRARIEARYTAERAACDALGGVKRDRCLIAAHAARGRALLEAAAPYEPRS
jgi:hypothetical protein